MIGVGTNNKQQPLVVHTQDVLCPDMDDDNDPSSAQAPCSLPSASPHSPVAMALPVPSPSPNPSSSTQTTQIAILNSQVEHWRQRAQEEALLRSAATATHRHQLIDELKSEASLWRTKYSELLEEQSALQARISSISSQNTLYDKTVVMLKAEVAALSGSLREAEGAVGRQAAEIAVLEEAKERLAEQVRALHQEVLEGRQQREAVEEASRRQLEGIERELQVAVAAAATATAAAAAATAAEKEKGEKRKEAVPIVQQQQENIQPYNAHQQPRIENKNEKKQVFENYAPTPAAAAVPPPPIQPPPVLPPPNSRRNHFETAKALAHRTAELEDDLLKLNIERGSLETELAKFPLNTAGRTVAERKRRVEIEQRLSSLGKEISVVRGELRQLGCH